VDEIMPVIEAISEEFTLAQLAEVQRLLKDMIAEGKDTVSPRDLFTIASTALFNLGHISMEEAEEVARQAGLYEHP
jgi:hypothetical protein